MHSQRPGDPDGAGVEKGTLCVGGLIREPQSQGLNHRGLSSHLLEGRAWDPQRDDGGVTHDPGRGGSALPHPGGQTCKMTVSPLQAPG